MVRKNILEFAKLLAGHDWTYHYSDSQSVWQTGSNERLAMRQFIVDNESIKDLLHAMYHAANPMTNGEIK